VLILATDQGGQGVQARSVPGFFRVVVLDRNDNLPMFDSPVRHTKAFTMMCHSPNM